MTERREQILAAAIEIVRESGYPLLTQPRVAARAGVRQSALTYYFPTRGDLLLAVTERIVDLQLAAFDASASRESPDAAAAFIGALTANASTTRALMTIVLAADAEPSARGAVDRLIDGMRARAAGLLTALGGDASRIELDARVLHSLAVGLAILTLAHSTDSPERAASDSAAVVRRLIEFFAS